MLAQTHPAMSVQLSFTQSFRPIAKSTQRGLEHILSVGREINGAEFDKLAPQASVLRKNQDGTDDWLFEVGQLCVTAAPHLYRTLSHYVAALKSWHPLGTESIYHLRIAATLETILWPSCFALPKSWMPCRRMERRSIPLRLVCTF